MRTLRKIVLLCAAAMAVLAMAASSASAVEIVRESDSAKCGAKICRVEMHDVGGWEFHDVFNIFHGVCDVEGEGTATHAGVITFDVVVISSCVGDNYKPCGTWSTTLTSTTAANHSFCVTVNGGSTQYSCNLSNMTVVESGHHYPMKDNSAGEQACSNGFQYVDFALAVEYEAGHPALEIR
jgi:hypothetical protein